VNASGSGILLVPMQEGSAGFYPSKLKPAGETPAPPEPDVISFALRCLAR